MWICFPSKMVMMLEPRLRQHQFRTWISAPWLKVQQSSKVVAEFYDHSGWQPNVSINHGLLLQAGWRVTCLLKSDWLVSKKCTDENFYVKEHNFPWNKSRTLIVYHQTCNCWLLNHFYICMVFNLVITLSLWLRWYFYTISIWYQVLLTEAWVIIREAVIITCS